MEFPEEWNIKSLAVVREVRSSPFRPILHALFNCRAPHSSELLFATGICNEGSTEC
jgi:hypothetical protein